MFYVKDYSSLVIHSFDHMIFVHDNSAWYTHPAYKDFIWIHVDVQHRFWYISKSYEFLSIINDDAQLNFSPLHYQCVIRNRNTSLSGPVRLNGALSHSITKMNNEKYYLFAFIHNYKKMNINTF